MKSSLTKLTLACLSAALFSTSAGAVTISSSAALQNLNVAAGLSGSFWHVGAGSTNQNIATPLTMLNTIGAATGTFVGTTLNYTGSDNSSISSWLGSDSSSYSGSLATTFKGMDDGIIRLTGYLKINAPSTLSFSFLHDDGGQLSVGGTILASSGCCGTNVVNATFSQAGYYAIDIVYANTDYYHIGGFAGGADMALRANGALLTGSLFHDVSAPPVPEPSSLALLGLSVAGALAARSRKQA